MQSTLSFYSLVGFLLLPAAVYGGAKSSSSFLSPQAKTHWASAYESAHALVNQMMLEEKINVTRGFKADNTCAGTTGSVPRLNWPGMCLHDAGNGVRAAELVNAYPAALHVGASWDKNLTYQRGHHMGAEFRAKGINVALGPNAGPLGRIPLGGRNWEGFSVDPYLSGRLNAETISGIQEAGVIATIKHLIANEQETYRRPYFGIEAVSSNLDDKTLHEYYLWPFMDSVRAGVASAMCSYNRVNGTYACESSKLMNGLLKGELGFKGFVVLDWNAQHNLNSANAGLDMVMPLAGSWGSNLSDALHNGTVTEERITDMATRIMAAWYLVGQDSFTEPGVGMKNLTEPHELVDARSPDSKAVLLEGAISGHVLLKNTNNTLPFRGKLRMLSIFGYDAALPQSKNTDILFQLGYYSSPEMAQAVLGTEAHFDQAARGGTIISGGRAAATAPSYIIDPLNALQQRAIKDDTWINWDTKSFDPPVNPASDSCLVFINAISTEGWDRDGLHDDFSDGLVSNVASKCANTIVIMHASGVRLVDRWIEHPNVTAVVLAHVPGQDSGRALVRLLYGEANFSGRLPYTMVKNESDYAVYSPCGLVHEGDTDPQCNFTEGSYLDYRDFDARNVTPRYEFGYGLTYTTFNYSSMSISARDARTYISDSLDELWETVAEVRVRVVNSGTVAGQEVAQLYLGISGAPPKQLRGFEKLPLQPGETGTAIFELTRRDLSQWDVVRQKWVLHPGDYKIYVGASSRDVRLTGNLVVST